MRKWFGDMTTHLVGRPCRLPNSRYGYDGVTDDWTRVTCTDCKQTKKFGRMMDAAGKVSR